MLTRAERATVVPSGPPTSPRLLLAEVRASHTIFDGGWWPYSWSPAEELPGLVLALSARYGQIRQVMLHDGSWNAGFRRLAVDSAVVRMGWFVSVDPGVLIATTEQGVQVDLLVVPPEATRADAEAVMRRAADPSNRLRAPAMLATLTPTASADRTDSLRSHAVRGDGNAGTEPAAV
ncbi:hypothetical protein Val02_52390 [Virgisporangium aliadipatigenens]|uniref:Uncharacterized protein n=1 Tax=Virgisporangium aliadipatigenens TaxID=741659 RepID=A0A8J3YRC5_9ACTN|nr:DUF5994 family protein [Virgisporangium aliadipatigenens]GIJ48353.1 hypothetical protein Val02_52390 [Virgisporangium aliadipatigenens]